MGNQENAAKDKGRSHVSKKPLDDGRQDISNDQKEKGPDVEVGDQGGKGKGAGNSDEDDENENVYEVERVVGHKRERGVVSYHLKWKGYPDSESTWEKEKSVYCKDLVEDYWTRYVKAGGSKLDAKGVEPKYQATKPGKEGNAPPSSKRPARGSVPVSKKKGRDGEDLSSSPSTKKQKTGPQSPQQKRTQDKAGQRGKENDPRLNEDAAEAPKGGEGDENMEERENWEPPETWDDWDEQMDVVQTVERSSLGMTVHVTWKNGKESEVPLKEAHRKCPQKLIAFYEQHLKFTPA